MAMTPPPPPARGWPKGAEGKELQSALFPGEQVLGWEQGRGGALLVATDRRVIIIKAGLASGQWLGKKSSVFPYQQIISVELQTIFGSGFVEIVTAGTQARRSGAFNKSADAYTADNMVGFMGSDKAWRPLVNLLRERVQLAHETPSPAMQAAAAAPAMQAAPSIPTIPEQIAQLAQLRDQGILSDQEFEAKKADLLARM